MPAKKPRKAKPSTLPATTGAAPSAKSGAKSTTKLTVAVIDRIVSFVRLGAYFETAAAAVNIHKSTLQEWLKIGGMELARQEQGLALRRDGALYLKLQDDMMQAIAESEVTDLDRIDKAADTIWQAAAWKLERRFPNRYSLRVKTEVAHSGTIGDGGAPTEKAAEKIDWSLLPVAERKVLLELIRKAKTLSKPAVIVNP